MSWKIVYFDKWCKDCEHATKQEYEEPCCDCLNEAGNEDSHKPVMFKEKDSE